jgi:hypothetical protein
VHRQLAGIVAQAPLEQLVDLVDRQRRELDDLLEERVRRRCV